MQRAAMFRALSRALAVAVCAAMVFGGVISAFADVYTWEKDYVTTSTNPGKASEYKVFWRENWGNDPLARFSMRLPSATETQSAIAGARYYLTRQSVDPSQNVPWIGTYNAVVADGSTWNLAVDVVGEVTNPGPLFGPTGAPAGATRPYEGPFILAYQLFTSDESYAAKDVLGFGLDMTPPAKVTGLTVLPGYGDDPVAGYLLQSRVHLFWEDKVYDALSGTGYFELFLDGKPYPAAIQGDTIVSRKVYDLKEHFPGWGQYVPTPREMTIEDLPAGKHTFQVRAVDRATNVGALSDPITLTIDPDFPDITILWPSVNGQTIGVAPTFKANVTDQGGVQSVKFYVDGVLRATDTVAPYAATVDLSAYGNGTTHALKVVAQDVGGRTNFSEKTFVLDKNKPVLTLLSAAPNPFFPRKREGYKDNFVARFKSNEACTATLTMKDSRGKVWRTITKSVPAGSSSITWNGKSNSNTMKSGTFSWTLQLSDAAGNRATKSGSVSLRYYEIIVSGGTARVIER